MENFLKYFLTFIFIFAVSFFLYSLSLEKTQSKVFFLDVGQGDATLIESKNGNQILIDGGRGQSTITELGKVMKYGDKEIDVVVITHYDFDHIGGLDLVLEKYKIKKIIVNGAPLSNKESKELFKIIKNKNIKVYKAHRGSRIKYGKNDSIDFLHPFDSDDVKAGNSGSLVMTVKTDKTKILISGDADTKIENTQVTMDKEILKSDILKIGHHGSKSSSSFDFLKATDPKVAIISAGFNNQYGHPHKVVLDRINFFNIPIMETKNGMIIFENP